MTITLTREEAQQVLDALTWCYDVTDWPVNGRTPQDKAIETLRARLAQPEPEPVAWMHSLTGGGWKVVPEKKYPTDRPLYTAPPQREWQGLTHEEIQRLWEASMGWMDFVRAIEAKLKEKNT